MPAIVMPSERSAKRGSKTFRPYEKQTLEAPFFHILLQPLIFLTRPVLAYIYAIRWQLSRPLNIRVLPRWVPAIDFPGMTGLTNLTFGQIFLSIPLAIAAIWFDNEIYQRAILLTVIINLFNLLPFLPLDGGWVMHALFFCLLQI